MANVNVDDVVGILSSPKFVDALQKPELQTAIHKLSPLTYEYITIWILIATVAVAAVSAILVWLQLRADHERSRRELAVNLINEWSNSIDIETAGVIRLVRELTRGQCELIASRKPFSVAKNNLDLVKGCLAIRFPEIDNDPQFDAQSTSTIININHRYSGYIRFSAARYLNSLEAIMIAWYESVVQPNIVEGQFRFLKSAPESSLVTLREAIRRENNDVDGFPCITRFLKNMEPKYGRRPGFADAFPFRRRGKGGDA
jgi:hypothetical protein